MALTIYIQKIQPIAPIITLGYFVASVSVCCVGSYFDSVEYLQKYRLRIASKKTATKNDTKTAKNDILNDILNEDYMKGTKQQPLTYDQINNKFWDNIHSEWDAVKYGSKINFWSRFRYSIVWPYHVSCEIIPALVLFFNRE